MEVVFFKVLSTTDATDRLALPMNAYRHFFPEEHDNCVHFMVTGSDQRPYNFRLAKRNKGKYPKPEITGGWREFVGKNGVKAGDKVTLYVHQDEAGAAHYTIEVKKEVKEELQKEVKKEVKEELQKEVKKEVKEELQKEVKKEVKEELQKEVKKGIRLFGTDICEVKKGIRLFGIDICEA